MGVIFQDLSELQRDLENLEAQYQPIVRECEILESQLDACKLAGYERFRNEVLQRELNAIAHERAIADPANVDLNRELRAKYEVIQSLAKRQLELEESYRVLTLDRAELMKRIDQARDRLTQKLKTQERKATHA